MICQACNIVVASIQFTEVVGDQKRKSWLCPACAQTRGLFVAANLEIEFGNSDLDSSLAAGHGPASRRCVCGTGLVSIRRSGRVGCAECYDTFAELLAPLLRRVHGRTEHGRSAGP